jgi:hypothetical protein
MGGLKVTWGRALSLKGWAKSLSECSLAYTDKQFAFPASLSRSICELYLCSKYVTPQHKTSLGQILESESLVLCDGVCCKSFPPIYSIL